MEDTQTYAQRLEASLAAKRVQLDSVELIKLRDSFKLFQSAFEGVRMVLFKKALIHDDPYKSELKISEVSHPPEGPFAETEKSEQMSIRISQFSSYLDFLNNYYQFSSDYITMGRVKKLLGLVKYFGFTQFSANSNLLNTRVLAEFVEHVKKGTDSLSTGIVCDAIVQLDKTSKEILSVLKELTSYHKERYKLEMRELVMPGISLDPTFVITHRDEAIKLVRRKFNEVAAERPFYAELVEEVFREDFSSDGPSLREEVLRRFALKGEKKVEKAPERSFRSILLEGVRVLTSIGYPLEDSLMKLGENSVLLQSRDQGLWARIRRLVRTLFKPEARGLVYEIEILDPITSQRRSEEVAFLQFVEETGKKAKGLSSVQQRGGTAYKRLESMPEEQVYRFLAKNLEEVQHILRILTGLDEFFKETITGEDKIRLKGIRVELTTMKGAVIKANQKKHEYVAQREELEQMRRLGIRDAAH